MNGLTTNASREASPLSAMVTSQNSSPSAFFNNSPSPTTGVDFISGQMLSGVAQTHPWPPGFDYGMTNTHIKSGLTPPFMNSMPTSLSSGLSLLDSAFKSILTIHPTPLKSRVETQIPIKLTLSPIPSGVTKLHLPTHTISKPKLLSKPPHEKSPDTLELYTTLVCTSAMQNPEFRRRAFTRAAAAHQPQDNHSDESAEGVSDEDDENKPLNGGEVKICTGCITRERKRAARKKVKKVEEEESWHKDECRRVIVFNTHEVKEWQQPSSQVQSEATGDRLEPIVPEGAMQVDAPMRIACYCRHQNEKLGFQVIFTIKDCNDRLVAQEITSSIMITDDHKTHNIPPLSTQTSHGPEGSLFPNGGIFPPDANFDIPMAPFRMSHSSSDLQTLQRNYPMSFAPPGSTPSSSHPSQATSATMTPRNMSRQASPSTSIGPNKKRKASGSGKVPTGLAMTRLETRQPTGTQTLSGTMSGTVSTVPSPYTPSIATFQTPHDYANNQLPPSMPNIPQQYNTGPPTPNSNDQVFFSNANRSHSMENLTMHQLYSAPTSAHPSRAPSPNGLRNNVQAYQQQQAQIAQAVANGLYGMPLSLNPHHPPTIHKMIPNEGPKAGGIEVTCLGSGFCQGLEVMFGETKATTTTYWGETSLVCLLPPAAFAGTVPVTFKHQHQQQQMQAYPTPPIPKQQAFFKYVDDDESQLIRTALLVLGHKMGGKIEDVRDLARRIVGDGSSSWGSSTSHSPPGPPQNQQVSGFNGITFGLDVEATLLRCLDLIDLDDSPNTPRLNYRRPSGQTMLHFACSLGLHRFVAALLARGTNPEPRDKGGFTPMHFAAMHGYPQIVRRLILSGADPTMRNLQGYTPSDLSTSEEVLRSTRRIEHHTRTRSGGSLRSKTSSATSLRSLWDPPTINPGSVIMANAQDESSEEDGDVDDRADEAFWMASRRASAPNPVIDFAPANQSSHVDIPPIIEGAVAGLGSPTAAMTAFRDQLSAQIQHLQQTMHLNLPNLPQMPTLPMMPNLPDYQAYFPTSPMVRRISSLVPHMGTSRPGTAEQPAKETDYRWWDLFSGSLPAAPPAYDDIFPQNDIEVKRSSAVQAAADTVADIKCSTLFDTPEGSGAGTRVATLDLTSIDNKHQITREEQDQLRLAHAEKVKKLRSDRNLFFIWVPTPCLLFLLLVLTINRSHCLWSSCLRCSTIGYRSFGLKQKNSSALYPIELATVLSRFYSLISPIIQGVLIWAQPRGTVTFKRSVIIPCQKRLAPILSHWIFSAGGAYEIAGPWEQEYACV